MEEDISAFESEEMRMRICKVCLENRGIAEALEDQPWTCSRCRTPLVGEIIHLQRCLNPAECEYEHMHHACYNEMVSELLT